MLSAAVKLLPLLAITGGAAASSPAVRAQIEKITNSTKVIATQTEVNAIAQMIEYEVLTDQPRPAPAEFADFVRKSLLNKKGQNRDTSFDLWNTPYGIAYDDAHRTLYVISAGPDKTYNTEDDIFATGVY